MKICESYKNKRFSILGDSISTLDGYSEPRDAAFYSGMQKCMSDVFFPDDTWWGLVIDSLGGELLKNNSISGSMVTRHPDCMIPSYGCSSERTSALGGEGLLPDVIMVFMGMNDRGRGVKPTASCESEMNDISIFEPAYEKMLNGLENNYPEAEIWCFTLPVSTCKNHTDFTFTYSYGGHHIDEYCQVIRSCAKRRGCRLIDLYHISEPYDTVDSLHPNADGMRTLADAVIKIIKG